MRRRTGIAFTVGDHVAAARHFGVRPQRGEEERTLDELFAEYFPAFKNYLYTQRWIDRLVEEFADDSVYMNACGREPRRHPIELPMTPNAEPADGPA